MISVKAYHNQEQNRRLRQLFLRNWAIQVRNPGMSRGWSMSEAQDKEVGQELEDGGAPACSRLSAGFLGKSRVQLGARVLGRCCELWG